MVKIGDPWADVPAPLASWTALTGEGRIIKVSEALHLGIDPPCVIAASLNGQIILALPNTIKARERGIWLRQAEAHLKLMVDPALVIYLDPTQDRNALRLLRGVEVRT